MKNAFKLIASLMLLAAAMRFESSAATYTISVDGATSSGPWSHFYEECVGSCHPITVLSSVYGRNIQPALRRGHAECGFKRIRAHNIFNDAPVYSEVNGTPVYNWTLVDKIYDSVTAIGMTVIVEFDGVPTGLASGTKTAFWYNVTPMNATLPKDYDKWRDMIKAFVLHLEQRYGVDAVRKNWAFEVWNEPNLTAFAIQDYYKLYDYAAEGVRLADSLCKVGGPATSGGDAGWIDQFSAHVVSGTNAATGKIGSKCDFVSYHRYADDGPYNGAQSIVSCPTSMNLYHKGMVALMNKNKFKGELQCTEWAPTYKTLALHSDEESSASFIVKTIHLLADNDLSQYPLPTIYSFWCISDIFEEWNAGSTTAFDNSYGLLLRGDKNIPDSWDVPKASYNAFRFLHLLGNKRIPLTGGTTGNGLNGIATISNDSAVLQVLLYNHVDSAAANSALSDSVVLTVNNIPFTSNKVKVEYWVLDRAHCNAYRIWQSMGSPKIPTATQWTSLKNAADFVYAAPSDTQTTVQKTFTKKFRANTYSLALVKLSQVTTVAVNEGKRAPFRKQPSISLGAASIIVNSSSRTLRIMDLRGKCVLTLQRSQQGNFRIDRRQLGKGVFIVQDETGRLPLINPLVLTK